MKKIIKNTTIEEIILFGLHIEAESSLELEPNFWQKLASDQDVNVLISSGSIVINDGSRDLDTDEALDFISINPSIFTRDRAFSSQTVVVYLGQQNLVCEEFSVDSNSEIVVNGTLCVLE